METILFNFLAVWVFVVVSLVAVRLLSCPAACGILVP